MAGRIAKLLAKVGDVLPVQAVLCQIDEGVTAGAAWQRIDFTDDAAASARTAAYGQFSGQTMQVGIGPLQQRLPRYLIEAHADRRAGAAADLAARARIYRISAMGFGAQDGTLVLLQAWYRRAGAD